MFSPSLLRHHRLLRRGVLLGLCVLAVGLMAAGEAPEKQPGAGADEPANSSNDDQDRAGHLVQVTLPITGSVDVDLQQRIDQELANLPTDGPRPVLVLEFAAKEGQKSEGSQFERSLAVARYLSGRRLARVRTVAYLPKTVHGHAVLAVLACEEIIMAPDAELGKAGIDEVSIDDTIRNGYREIAKRRRVIPAAFALGMLDPDLRVYKVVGEDRFVLEDEKRQLESEGKASEFETVTDRGESPSFRGSELRHKYRVVSHLVENKKELAAALKLAPGSLESDPSMGGSWQAIGAELRGDMNRKTVNEVLQGLRSKLRNEDLNFVWVLIDSPGGSPRASTDLAYELAELKPDRVRTVAFILHQARSDAALVALACDHIVMHRDARLGGPGAHQMNDKERQVMRETVEALATKKGRDWSLTAALVDSQLTGVVHKYTRIGTGEERYFCEEELKNRDDADRWQQQNEIKATEGINGEQASGLGLVRDFADDFDAFRRLYDLPDDPDTIKPAWSNIWIQQFAEFLAQPMLGGMLLFAAWFFLSAEMSHPGLSAPGFLAAVCFMLFFWSQFLHGNATGLEILLFVVGVVCVALEIFVIPGIGIFGIGGAVMIIVSIVLASQSFVIPRNSYQFSQLPASLSMLLAGISGVVVFLVVMRRFLPDTPYFNRMMLQPPHDEEIDELKERESLVRWEHLSGKRGVTTTQLTPSGKASFGDDVVDVISHGEPIARGAKVYVTEVRGSRVVVRSIEDGGQPN